MVSREDGLEVGLDGVGFDEGELDGMLLGMLVPGIPDGLLLVKLVVGGLLDGWLLSKLIVGGLDSWLVGKFVVGGLESVEGVGISVVGIDVVG